MPQAADWLRDKIEEYFNNGLDDSGPWLYLKEQGYTEDRFMISIPDKYTDLQDIPEKEWNCLLFLTDEWDWGTHWPR